MHHDCYNSISLLVGSGYIHRLGAIHPFCFHLAPPKLQSHTPLDSDNSVGGMAAAVYAIVACPFNFNLSRKLRFRPEIGSVFGLILTLFSRRSFPQQRRTTKDSVTV